VPGVAIVWVCAPPSDQDTNWYVVPYSVCGAGALNSRLKLTTPVKVYGVVIGWPLRSRPSPGGCVVNVTFRVIGVISRVTSLTLPSESVARRCTRYHVFADDSPVSGMTNVPDETPLKGSMNGWVCVSWWNRTSHVRLDGGSVPSSVSVADPAKEIVSPAR